MNGPGRCSAEHFANAVRLRGMLLGRLVSAAISAAARLWLPDLMAGGPRRAEDLANATKTEPVALRQLLRALAALGLVTEHRDGVFELTALGHALRSDVPGTARPSALLASGEIGQAWDGLLDSVRTGESAFDKIFGTDVFSYLGDNPELLKTFYASQTADLQTTLAGLADVDFTGFRTIVDVGGGDGALLAHVLTRYPNARGILLDHESVVPTAKQRLAAAGLSDRCEVVAGDFFVEVPADGELYLVRDILHDWPDDRCVDLLRVCRRAMPDDAGLMVIERVSAGVGDQQTALMGLYMLSVLGGHERTLDEYRNLLRQAGLRPFLVHGLPAGATIIEATAAVAPDLACGPRNPA